MRIAHTSLSLSLALHLATAALSQSECAKLEAADAAFKDNFGVSVALSDERALVGSYRDDDGGTDSGSAYLLDACTGVQLLKLTAPDAAPGDLFGLATALGGGLAAVGAPNHEHGAYRSGAVYLFDATTGVLLQELVASDVQTMGHFGSSVALDSDRVIVGAFNLSGGSSKGAVYIFDAASGLELLRIPAPGGDQNEYFGLSVALDGDRAVIGARYAGKAYVFDATTGQPIAELLVSHPNASPFFGERVAAFGDVAIVGDWDDDEFGDHAGAAWLFDLTTGQPIHRLTAGDAAPDALFGESVAIRGPFAIVGARWADGAGVTYVFDVATGVQLARLTPSDGQVGDEFGRSVTISGELVAAGAWKHAGAAASSGAAYVFDLADGIGTSTCGPANPNSSGQPGIAVAYGSDVVSDNGLAIQARQLPAKRYGYAMLSQTPDFVAFAGGSQGNLCLGGQIGRLAQQARATDAAGTFVVPVDLTTLPLGLVVLPGETWFFQVWYRDVNPSPTSNFTDAVSVTFA